MCYYIYLYFNNKIVGGYMWDLKAQFEKILLPNGLRIYVAQIPGREIELVNFIVHSGSLRDSRSALGTAHFLEHMLSEDVNLERLFGLIDKDGGDFNLGKTNRMSTEFSFLSTSKNFEMFFEVFESMIMEKRNFISKIEKERKIIKREFFRKYPYMELFELEAKKKKAVYDNAHILSQVATSIGSLDSITKITNEDLCNFHKTYYVPQNISIVAIGEISKEEILPIIKKGPFGETKKQEEYEIIPKITTMREPTSNCCVLKVSDFSSLEAKYMRFSCTVVLPITIDLFGFHIFKRLLRRKLNNEIREKRSWAYDISCKFWKTDYAYEFEIECRELSLEAENEIFLIIDKCVGEIYIDILGFKRAQKGFIAEYKFIDLNITDTMELVTEQIIYYNDLVSTEEIIKKINDVKFEQIRELCDMMHEKYRYYKFVLP